MSECVCVCVREREREREREFKVQFPLINKKLLKQLVQFSLDTAVLDVILQPYRPCWHTYCTYIHTVKQYIDTMLL